MKAACLIVGAGGHAKVVADALSAAGETIVGFLDQDSSRHGAVVLGLPILGGDEVLDGSDFAEIALINGIGGAGADLALRRKVQARLERQGRRFRGVRHPSSIIASSARLAHDVQVFARAVIQAEAEIGAGCIVNTAAVVEHDCRLGAFVHCAPGTLLCGDVWVGDGSHVGAGAVIRQGVHLGPQTLVGAGATVIADDPGGGRLLGVPARRG